jgi:hypothetical protein
MYGRADGMPRSLQSVVVCDGNSNILNYKGLSSLVLELPIDTLAPPVGPRLYLKHL